MHRVDSSQCESSTRFGKMANIIVILAIIAFSSMNCRSFSFTAVNNDFHKLLVNLVFEFYFVTVAWKVE